MKILLMILSGCVVTIGFYAVGLVTAIFFLSAEPAPAWKPSADAGGKWTLEPVTVARADQDFERVSPTSVQGSFETGESTTPAGSDLERAGERVAVTIASEAPVDRITTASLTDDAPALQPDSAAGIEADHIEWCANRYRSYRVETNSYTAYSGETRECVSPHSGGSIASYDDEGLYASAQAPAPATAGLSARHIQSCFDRYRSYRPEDNSYQPYSGGPRRQCR